MHCRGTPKSIEHNPRATEPLDAARLAAGDDSPSSLAASLSHRAIRSARSHAELVDAVEACAPIVTASYLQAAYDRMRLPVSVRMHDWRDLGTHYQFDVEALDLSPFGKFDIVRTVTPDPRDATRAYLDLCRSLSAPSDASRVRKPAAGAS